MRIPHKETPDQMVARLNQEIGVHEGEWLTAIEVDPVSYFSELPKSPAENMFRTLFILEQVIENPDVRFSFFLKQEHGKKKKEFGDNSLTYIIINGQLLERFYTERTIITSTYQSFELESSSWYQKNSFSERELPKEVCARVIQSRFGGKAIIQPDSSIKIRNNKNIIHLDNVFSREKNEHYYDPVLSFDINYEDEADEVLLDGVKRYVEKHITPVRLNIAMKILNPDSIIGKLDINDNRLFSAESPEDEFFMSMKIKWDKDTYFSINQGVVALPLTFEGAKLCGLIRSKSNEWPTVAFTYHLGGWFQTAQELEDAQPEFVYGYQKFYPQRHADKFIIIDSHHEPIYVSPSEEFCICVDKSVDNWSENLVLQIYFSKEVLLKKLEPRLEQSRQEIEDAQAKQLKLEEIERLLRG